MPRIVVCIGAIALGLVGCAASPKRATADVNLHQASTLEAAVTEAPFSKSITLAEPLSLELDEDSPILSDSKVKAPYQRLVVTLPRSAELQIETRSYCACFGGGKYLMVPRLFAAESLKDPVELTPTASHFEPESFFSPVSIMSSWQTKTMPAGKTVLLVVADTRELGEEVHRTDLAGRPPGVRFILELLGANRLIEYPYGSFEIKVVAK